MNSSCSGYCVRCGQVHSLPSGRAEKYCLELMKVLEEKKRVDLYNSDAEADSQFNTDYLFGKALGQMFGVLLCRDAHGALITLRAFSGQYNGTWEVQGWVPPLLKVSDFNRLNSDGDKKIKEYGRKMELCTPLSTEREELRRQRKLFSRQLMKNIHGLYELTSFWGETCGLDEIILGDTGIPTGTGDCCAPKLLNHAAKNGLIPLGLGEFFWGKENRSASRQHGIFYGACREKCQPILGFMLCGLQEDNEK